MAQSDSYMEKAFILSQEAMNANEVPVGCVIVGPYLEKETIIGEGRNEVNLTKNPTRHAELVAIDRAVDFCIKNNLKSSEIFEQSTFYVNVEPCIMCASALQQLQVKKVIFGCRNPRFGGMGTVIDVQGSISGHQVQVQEGIRSDEAVQMLREFYKRENPFAPNPISKTERN